MTEPQAGYSDRESAARLWQELLQLGWVKGDEPEVAPASPWYLVLLLLIAAWMAASFLLGFMTSLLLLVLDEIDTGATIGIGSFYSLLGLWLYRSPVSAAREFASQLAFAINLSGLIALGWGLFELLDMHLSVSWYGGMALVMALHFMLISHTPHQFITALGLCACGTGLLQEYGALALAPALTVLLLALVWLTLSHWGLQYRRGRVLGYGLALWVLFIQLPYLFNGQGVSEQHAQGMDWSLLAPLLHHDWQWYLSLLLSLGVILLLGLKALAQQGLGLGSRQGALVLMAVAGVGLLSVPMAGLAAAVCVFILGLYFKERGLICLAVLSCLLFIGGYYYSLRVDLMEKSLYLAGFGAALLGARGLMQWSLAHKTPGGNHD
ncbi:DUF4401 domain-containing protein [Shewanella sp. AS16]|uniref:DUF4401 domain-containing protein n=1 Tax=Shewanella sp. AS16 TaxID=2907625 RepID=UPI001F2633B4|nr:DUF4401 domain-containing protein [Shewanella sp. AS16]MCE9684811.1 DUF4401 domain-containing protein [Shewanella sp. AS16]